MKLVASILFLTLALAGAERKPVVPGGGPKPVGPYSPGIMAGNFLYVSGQGMRDANNNMPDGNEERVRQCLRNVENIVKAAGLTMDHVVYTQVYLHPSMPYEVLNKVWDEVFKKDPPARATLGVYRMPTETTVEVSAVAVRDLAQKKIIRPDWYPKNLNISPAVEAHGRVYLSGFLGRDVQTGTIPSDPKEQMELALLRIKQILEAAGLDYRHLVMVNPYHTNAMPRRVLDSEYAKRFSFGNTPARATIEVNHLPLGANIELTAIAVRDLSKRQAVKPRNMPPSATASPCVLADDTLYCSAKAGFIPGANGGIYSESVEDQVRMTMRNLLDGLEEAGMTFANVVKSNVYLDTIDDFPKMNGVYAKYFGDGPPPTRTTVEPLAPIARKRGESGHYPKLEEISIVAVR
ncbi:MAG: RidA family protein [Acidobacteria bacterium]|nr:RidA family protein [Acidobacteriota bacterium]